MAASSLANRLFLSATAWLVVILAITGVVLSSVYKSATERAFDRRLNLYLRTLIAEVATPDEPPDRQFQSLGEPLFELPLSGWYWQITRTDTEKPEVRSSRSLWDKKLPKLEEQGTELTAAGIRLAYVDGPEGQNFRMVERPVDLGADGKYLVSVAGDDTEIFDETRSFDYYLGGTFTALGIVLLLTTVFQVRFGLAPLKRISESIADIRSGRAERLEGEFPVEIAPLARETNALIDANREIVERARTHVGNLAHAIKTPLSVIVNEAGTHATEPFAAKVMEQADVMRDQLAHHLERAHRGARLGGRDRDGGRTRHRGAAADHGEDPSRSRDTGRGEGRSVRKVSRRAARSGGDGRQSRRQCLQMGGLAGLHRGSGGSAAPDGRRPAPADHRRRRWPRTVGGRARPGLLARPAARRVQARLGTRPVHRDRPRRALWRQPLARGRPDWWPAGGAGPPRNIILCSGSTI